MLEHDSFIYENQPEKPSRASQLCKKLHSFSRQKSFAFDSLIVLNPNKKNSSWKTFRNSVLFVCLVQQCAGVVSQSYLATGRTGTPVTTTNQHLLFQAFSVACPVPATVPAPVASNVHFPEAAQRGAVGGCRARERREAFMERQGL